MAERLFHRAAVPFEAARRIAVLPSEHRARRLHGHSFCSRVLAELPPGWGGFDGAETDTLSAALGRAVAPLDYADLNAHLPVPTDDNLARWLLQRLRAELGSPAAIAQLGIQSTTDQGTELLIARTAEGPSPRMHHWRRYRFEAAHRLINVPPDHPCGRMHGHGFEVLLHTEPGLSAQPDTRASEDQRPVDTALALAGEQLDAHWAPLHEQLDHRCLNDLTGLENPTSERLAHWLWARLKPRVPALTQVSVYETATAGCHYDGVAYRIWKEMRFESALRLTQAPSGDVRRRMHGHSYLLRLHLTAPLDEVLGWTVDYGDVKRLFQPVYAQLDHQELNGLEQARSPSAANLAAWIRGRVADVLPQVDRIELNERPDRGVLLCWNSEEPSDVPPLPSSR